MKPTTKMLVMNHAKEKEHERERPYAGRRDYDYEWRNGNRYDDDRYERINGYGRERYGTARQDSRRRNAMWDDDGIEPGKYSGRHVNRGLTSDSDNGDTPFTMDMAEIWMKSLTNEDGSRGPHWTLEQAKQLQTQKNIDCDPAEFWAALNMIYSDYFKAAKKFGVGGNVDFYAEMAKAFLDDKDAREDKMSRYFAYIIQH